MSFNRRGKKTRRYSGGLYENFILGVCAYRSIKNIDIWLGMFTYSGSVIPVPGSLFRDSFTYTVRQVQVHEIVALKKKQGLTVSCFPTMWTRFSEPM